MVTGPCPPHQELLLKMRGRGFPWSRLLLVLLVLAAGFFLHDVQTHGSFQGKGGSYRVIQAGKILWEHQASSTMIPCPHKCHIHMAYKSIPQGMETSPLP